MIYTRVFFIFERVDVHSITSDGLQETERKDASPFSHSQRWYLALVSPLLWSYYHLLLALSVRLPHVWQHTVYH